MSAPTHEPANVPADVLQAAREAAAKVWGIGEGSEALAAEFRSGMRDDSGSVETAVVAILAERQRMLDICAAEREWGDFHPDDVTSRIQSGSGPRQIPGWNCPADE